MSGRDWAPDVTVRERRWAPVLAIALGLGMVVTAALFIATTDGNDPSMLIASFLVTATVGTVACVGLRVRLLGDRAGIRQARTFVPWYEVVGIDEPEGTERGGSLRLTGDRVATFPRSTLERHRRGLVALREEAARHGVGVVSDPAVSPLRSLPMDREPLPVGIARAISSIVFAFLVLAIALLPMLPPTSPSLDSAPVRHFPEDALRPIWTRYLLPPSANPQSVTPQAAEGRIALLQGIDWVNRQDLAELLLTEPTANRAPLADGYPVAEAAVPVDAADFALQYRYSPRTPSALLTGFRPSGRADWEHLILDPGRVRAAATNSSGTVLSEVIQDRNIGGQFCCRLSFLDTSGHIQWSQRMEELSEVGQILASNDRFFLIHGGGATRIAKREVEVYVLSPDGVIEEEWTERVPGWNMDQAWVVDDGLVFSFSERHGSRLERSFMLMQVDGDGVPLWRLEVDGMLQDLAATNSGIALLKTDPEPSQNYYLHPPQIFALGIRNGEVEWTRPFADDREAQSFLRDGTKVYIMTRGPGPAGPEVHVQRMDPSTGTLGRRWEIATVRDYPTMLVTEGIAYLISQDFRPYSLQRYDWPPPNEEIVTRET